MRRSIHPVITTGTTQSRKDGTAPADDKVALRVGAGVGVEHHVAALGLYQEAAVGLEEEGEGMPLCPQDVDHLPFRDHARPRALIIRHRSS